MIAWLDENCGADGWAMTPSGMRGVLNDAVSIYFPDPALAGATNRPRPGVSVRQLILPGSPKYGPIPM